MRTFDTVLLVGNFAFALVYIWSGQGAAWIASINLLAVMGLAYTLGMRHG